LLPFHNAAFSERLAEKPRVFRAIEFPPCLIFIQQQKLNLMKQFPGTKNQTFIQIVSAMPGVRHPPQQQLLSPAAHVQHDSKPQETPAVLVGTRIERIKTDF